ncbi:uncharacterized protein RAG0_09380 [Rhynchosporium agropyri]|uniref:PPM-type phosphatase domain-containing protein n=1 Tax=Rhynchosporium agropyri TaxID=914238 RepID=A0A1E1KVA1_9HELO|nr:uncharacterized protein RAG0_09380 [Rhynchosporium agropyri]
MQEAFVKLDGSIFKTAIDAYQTNLPLQDKLTNMAPAFAGSCALLSLYDPEKNKVHVACTGDSRAVYGQQNDQGVWEAIPMSIDQSGYNEAEKQKPHASKRSTQAKTSRSSAAVEFWES